MRCLRSPDRPPRRGAILVQAALCLIPILGVAAIVVDGGVLLSERRHAQATADAAALAAANCLVRGGDVTKATNRALTIAAANGYSNDGTTTLITPNDPGVSGAPVHGVWSPP